MISSRRSPVPTKLRVNLRLDLGSARFLLIWFGQLVSIIGSGLTSFALGIRVYQLTGSVTRFAFISVCFTLPAILVFPLAGVIIDRSNRRTVMLASDLAAGFSTLVLACLFFFGSLSLWEICLLVGIGSLAEAFRLPSYTAILGQMVSAQHIGRISGLLQFAPAAAQVVAPALAAVMMGAIGLKGVLLVDFLTFIVAISTLLAVDIPVLPREAAHTSWLKDTAEGLKFIARRRGLSALLSFFFIINFTYSTAQILLPPVVLAFTSPKMLGAILSSGAVGYLGGSILMVLWRGPQKRVHGLLISAFVYALSLVLAALSASSALITLAAFIMFSQIPVMNTCSQAIWLFKVPLSMQGRVFSTRMMLAWSSIPFAYFLAGPLADRVFEPLLQANGKLANTWISCIGIGRGRGTAFLLMLNGVLALMFVAGYYLKPQFLHVEKNLPDTVANHSSKIDDGTSLTDSVFSA